MATERLAACDKPHLDLGRYADRLSCPLYSTTRPHATQERHDKNRFSAPHPVAEAVPRERLGMKARTAAETVPLESRLLV